MKNLNDAKYMTRALQLAEQGLWTTDPNPRVGCVIVKDGEIVGEGWHHKAGEPHAEINALKMAGKKAENSTVYVTLEPCCHFGRTPPCSQALIFAKVSRVVSAMVDPNPKVAGQGLAQLQAAGIEVKSGILQEQAETLNVGFIKRMREKLPFVRLKLAMSLDGRTAMKNGESQWITSPDSRNDVQRWRARSSAILTGINTILADNPALTVRLPNVSRQPLRVVLDTHLRISSCSNIFAQQGKNLILTAKETSLTFPNTDIKQISLKNNRLNLLEVCQTLAKMEINELFVECGATLAGAFISEKLVDELILYVAPTFLGDQARGLLQLPQLIHLQDRINFQIKEIRHIGQDLRLILRF
jgi:diaminohydroxyphosphoribosylaminopyrimidine deaminase / 5-amino-6-(5-phosphoribosylamino)uracil reductase